MADAALAKPVARKAPAADPKADPAVPKSSISGAASGVPLFLQHQDCSGGAMPFEQRITDGRGDDEHPTGSSIEANSGSLQGVERRIGIQAKLVVRQPGDLFEREADAPAQRAAAGRSSAVQRKCANCEPGKPCAECAQQGEEQLLQRKPVETASVSSLPISARSPRPPDSGNTLNNAVRSRVEPSAQQQTDGMVADVVPTTVSNGAQRLFRRDDEAVTPRIPKGSGQPLPPEHRRLFEQTLNHPLDHVRIHTETGADRASRRMNAEAFTVGSDIYFSERSYSPGTAGGDRVLAHELTHIVQHDEGRVPEPAAPDCAVSQPTDPLEVEAYTQESAIASTVGTLRGIGEVPILPPSFAPAANADPVIARREASHLSVGSENAVADDAAITGDPALGNGPTDYQLIPPIPEHPSPFGQSAPATVETSLAAVTSRVPESLAPLSPPTEAAAPAQQPAGGEPASAPNFASIAEPREAELEWVEGAAGPVIPELPTEEWTAPAEPLAEPARPDGADEIYRTSEDRAAALESQTQALTQRLASANAQSLTAMIGQIAQLTASVHFEAEQARSEINAAYIAQQEGISVEVEATLGTITQSHGQQKEAVSTFVESERERLQTAKLTEQETAAALIEELKAATLVSGESEAQRALVGSEERAQTILAEADAIGAGGEPASVVAQREAAHRIAQHAADKCRETGDNLASDVREEAPLHTGNYDELLQSFFDRLEQTVADADASLNGFANDASGVVDSRSEQALAAAREMANQGSASLECRRSAAEEQINAWEEQAAGIIEEAGNQLSGPLSDQTETIRVSLENYGTGAAAQLRSMTSPEEAEAAATIADEKLRDCYTGTISALGEFNGNTATELSGLFEELRANLASIVSARCSAATETGAAMGQTLRETSEAGVTAMECAASSFQERLSAGVNDAMQEMASSGAQFRSQTRQAHEDAMSKFAQLIDDGFSSEDNLITDARSEISSAVEEIAGKYAET